MTGIHMKIELELLPDTLTIHRLHPDDPFPVQLAAAQPVAIIRTERELSVVCPQDVLLDSQVSETGWRAFRVKGTLDFGLTGILAGIATCLSDAAISIFALSTFETDVILVKQDQLAKAEATLENAGYPVSETG